MRRQEEEEELQTLRRQGEEEAEAQPLRRQEEEEALQTVRRKEEEEELQTLRRQEEEEAEAQPLRRMEAAPETLDPESSAMPAEIAQDPEPPIANPLRRDVAPSTPTPTTAHPIEMPGLDAGLMGPEPMPMPQSFERPSVQIDQIDVMIHEADPASRTVQPDRSRALRARYLRRL
ncbi:MAG: hypothetical protein AAF415_02525 [Pseudomonadota bacterium]